MEAFFTDFPVFSSSFSTADLMHSLKVSTSSTFDFLTPCETTSVEPNTLILSPSPLSSPKIAFTLELPISKAAFNTTSPIKHSPAYFTI